MLSYWKLRGFVLIALSAGIVGGVAAFIFKPVHSDGAFSTFTKVWISEQIKSDLQKMSFPEAVKNMQVEYGLDPQLQEFADDLLHKYRPDYAAIVAVNARTGQILAMTSYNHLHEEKNYALIATFPAASVFKLVTATAALDQNLVTPETILPFNGASHTLYKKNIIKTDLNRWTNYMTLKDAFAHSVNTFFGKLGLYHVGTDGLAKYSERFGFNRPIAADFPIESSTVRVEGVDDLFSIAEAASGFTRNTTLSPVQGALMAASVVNDGIMMEPYLVEDLRDADGQRIYKAEPTVLSTTMKSETAELVRQLMRNTVEHGTSRKAFRRLLLNKKFADVDMGGKTGSLNGLAPRGRTDWFIGYLRLRDQKIGFAAVSVHQNLWRVRSSQLASEFFKKYLDDSHLPLSEPANIQLGLKLKDNVNN